MNFISLKHTKKFAKLSGDKNNIHLESKVAKRYFFREPIAHGINLVNIALTKFFKNDFRLLNYEIIELKILFKSFCLINEKIFFEFKKTKIIIKGKSNEKVIILFKLRKIIKNFNKKLDNKTKKIFKFYKLPINSNMFFLDHLTELSKIAGNHKPKSKTLIHSIHLKKNYNHNKSFKKVNKITRNTYLVNFSNKLYFSNTIISKLVDLNFNKNRFKLNKKTNYAIKKKKILFFGISSNLAQATLLFIKKFNLKIFSFSLNKFNSNYKKNKKKLEIYLLKIKPDYIFYFSSPRIIIEKKFDSFFEDYNDVYYKKFKLVLNIILKNNLNSIIFYPSSFFLDKTNSFVRFKSYIKAKKKAENLYRIKKFQKHFKFYRLPQFKTRSTYNMLGYYSGIDLFNLKKYLEDFFLTKQ